MQQALSKYTVTKNINEYISILEKHKGCPKEELYWAIAGTHYMTPPLSNYDAAKKLLLKSETINVNVVASYNLGYIYEQLIKNNSDTKNNDEYEKNMLLHYKQAVELNEMKAANQIGLYYIDKDVVPNTYLTPEAYMLMAHNAGIMQGTNNLIDYYRKKNNYEKCIQIMIHKYNKTKDMIELMNVMTYMLNNNKYADYCKFMKSLGKNDMEMNALITYKNMKDDECCVCLEVKKSFILDCSHCVCNSCMYKIFTDVDAKCPLCRKELTKKLSVST